MKRVADLGSSALMQHALAEFMERGYLRAHMTRIIPEYRARRDALEEALSKSLPTEVHWQRPSHGVVSWLRLPPGLDPEAAYEEALRRGVVVSPSTMWSPDPGGQPGLRLVFCAEPKERLVTGAKRLGEALRAVLARDRTQRDEPVRELV
jgi:DNA-binding transcriptional MocR family regulator